MAASGLRGIFLSGCPAAAEPVRWQRLRSRALPLRVQEWAHSAELLVMGAPVSGALAFEAGALIGGYRLMVANARQVRDGAVPLADPAGPRTDALTGRRVGATWFPWYLYEGEAACIGLIVRRHDLAGVACNWNAGVTVWPLELVGNPDGGNPNGRHRSSRAAWRGGGEPVRGVRAPLAFAARGAEPRGFVGRVLGGAR